MIEPLFDTGLVLHYTRQASPVVAQVEADYALSASPFRPSISVVTIGEMRAFALGFGERRATLTESILRDFNVVNINREDVLASYAFMHDAVHGLPGRSDQNDLWIAACAQASGQTLLTLDKGFLRLPQGCIKLILMNRDTGVTETTWP